MRVLASLALMLLTTTAFAAADYEREKRWDDEVTPGIVVGEPVYLTQKNGHKFLGIYTEAADAKMAVVVVHGMGIHPDWGMIGTLRQQLPEQGYTTLSIQMPVLAADAKPEHYAPVMPEAVERLALAVAELKAKGHKRIALVSHSMGSRMTHAYMSKNPPAVAAWASLGIGTDVRTGKPLTYSGIKVPVLDLYGENDNPPVLKGAAARKASLKNKPGSKQIAITGGDHFFAGHEDAMVKAVKDFLDGVK